MKGEELTVNSIINFSEANYDAAAARIPSQGLGKN